MRPVTLKMIFPTVLPMIDKFSSRVPEWLIQFGMGAFSI